LLDGASQLLYTNQSAALYQMFISWGRAGAVATPLLANVFNMNEDEYKPVAQIPGRFTDWVHAVLVEQGDIRVVEGNYSNSGRHWSDQIVSTEDAKGVDFVTDFSNSGKTYFVGRSSLPLFRKPIVIIDTTGEYSKCVSYFNAEVLELTVAPSELPLGVSSTPLTRRRALRGQAQNPAFFRPHCDCGNEPAESLGALKISGKKLL